MYDVFDFVTLKDGRQGIVVGFSGNRYVVNCGINPNDLVSEVIEESEIESLFHWV